MFLFIGIFVVMNYYKVGNINWIYGIIIVLVFVIGGYVGFKIFFKFFFVVVKFFFGVIMIYVVVTMIISGYKVYWKEKNFVVEKIEQIL